MPLAGAFALPAYWALEGSLTPSTAHALQPLTQLYISLKVGPNSPNVAGRSAGRGFSTTAGFAAPFKAAVEEFTLDANAPCCKDEAVSA